MSTYAFFVLCVQACLISGVGGTQIVKTKLNGFYNKLLKVVYSQYMGCGPALAPLYEPVVRGGCGAAYGGSGVGNLAVAGELPVAGTTVVAGQVPIIGAVEFGGPAVAAGAVTITGSCGCGCGGPYYY